MLKETPKSLRLYFGLIAAYTLIKGLEGALAFGPPAARFFVVTVVLVMSSLYGYVFFRFHRLLSGRPRFIKTVLTIDLIRTLLGFGLVLLVKREGPTAIGMSLGLLLSVLVYVYLMKSVTRLSAQVQTPPVVAPPQN